MKQHSPASVPTLLAPVAAAILLPWPAAHAAGAAAPAQTLSPVVVTSEVGSEPLSLSTNPRTARQPMPAMDGADILKTIPGFSVIRKGGTDSDPVLRGMAGSRLGVLLDGEHIMGGCGMRMDPPTAYVFPDSYDRITVLKGPQSVAHGSGNPAGVVLFERDRLPVAQGLKGNFSLTGASFGRADAMADLAYATSGFYVRGTTSFTRANDYKDGDGLPVHSSYKRWSARLAAGWTPDADTLLELSYARSDGEAAYADRMMDGTVFDRENLGLRFEKRNISPVLRKLEANVFRNYVDHVMDNFSMRPTTPPARRQANNPDRDTVGARVAATLQLGENAQLLTGIDARRDQHTLRMGMGANAGAAYQNVPRMDDARFRQTGLFGELRYTLGSQDLLATGLRLDRWQLTDQRIAPAIATRGQKRSASLPSGFVRWEHGIDGGNGTVYAGLGHAQRFPDYWESVGANRQSTTTNSAFHTEPEKTTQLDLGLNWKSGSLNADVSAWYADIRDYILIDGFRTNLRFGKPAAMPPVSVVRNIDARAWGLEAGVGWAFAPSWKLDASLASARGSNRTDGTALAQMPPLEARLGLGWDNGTWAAGALWRGVAAQTRVDMGKGNIAGQDLGPTPGFGVLSLHGSYRVNKNLRLIAGVDNALNRRYVEALSRGDFDIAGYTRTGRVAEPGRSWWLKAVASID